MLKFRWLSWLLIPASVIAETCVLTDRTVTQSSVSIAERSGVKHEVVVLPTGQHRCQVSFRARIGAEWHTAFGEYDWPGDRPRAEACGVAAQRAESDVIVRAGRTLANIEKVMTCRDDPDLQTLRRTVTGARGQLHQFRPHPDFPNRFWHNGTQCRWFLDSEFRRNDIYTYQGVICAVQGSEWVVVDKF